LLLKEINPFIFFFFYTNYYHNIYILVEYSSIVTCVEGGILMKTLFALLFCMMIAISFASALPQETMRQDVIVRGYYSGDEYVPAKSPSGNVYVVVHNDEVKRDVTDSRGNILGTCPPKDMKQVSVSVIIEDLGMKWKSNNLKIETRHEELFEVPVELPDDVPKGEYWARITVSNDDYRRVKYRAIVVE
jgi:hypothetical protein